MQASQKPVIWTIVGVTVAILLGQLFMAMLLAPTPVEPASAAEIAAAIAPLITIPEVVSPDAEKLDRLCELTNGCELYEISGTDARRAVNEVDNEVPRSKDFEKAFANLVGIDRDYLDIDRVDLRDSRVTALSEQDEEDENFVVELFYKVKYKDSDDDDLSNAYILVTSTLDEGDYDSMTVEEVDRTFEFD